MSKPTSKVLSVRLGAMRWLRFERRCAMVMHERGPWYTFGVPDVIGVTQAAQVIEIEVKVTRADFRREKLKDKWRADRAFQLPHQFYFAVPNELADCVEREIVLFPQAGLIVVDKMSQPLVRVSSEVNKNARKLDDHQWKRAVDCQANCVVSLTRQLLQALSTFGRPDLNPQ